MTAPQWKPRVLDEAKFNAAMGRLIESTAGLVGYANDLQLTRTLGLRPCAGDHEHLGGCGCAL